MLARKLGRAEASEKYRATQATEEKRGTCCGVVFLRSSRVTPGKKIFLLRFTPPENAISVFIGPTCLVPIYSITRIISYRLQGVFSLRSIHLASYFIPFDFVSLYYLQFYFILFYLHFDLSYPYPIQFHFLFYLHSTRVQSFHLNSNSN